VNVDHVVLWVDSPKNSLGFFVDVVGLRPVRKQEFEEGTAHFPSVRLNDMTILDLMDRNTVSLVQDFTGGGGDAGKVWPRCTRALGGRRN
jgi:glyoxylase I family protein